MNAAIMKKEKDTSLIIVNIIFIVSTILLVLKGAPYFYIITILAISSNYKEKAYIFTNIVALIISFITSINNGYEMVIVCSTFFLLKIISNFYIKNNVIKRMLPYVITNLVLFLIYLKYIYLHLIVHLILFLLPCTSVHIS